MDEYKLGCSLHRGREDLGTIEPGKLADLVILEGDYLTVPEDQISQLPIRMTLVDGRIVHEATAAGQ